MTTRLVVCFDGTWNSPGNDPASATSVETNVVRFYQSVLKGELSDGSIQKPWYDEGVGTDWYDKLPGGVTGVGLDQKIKQGYQYLVENYPDPDPGDVEVFVLGFSRGAYTARSMVGMIRNVGLLKPGNVGHIDDAYALYRKRDESADTPEAQAFRQNYSRDITIKFLGVWDTVGALGIPLPALEWLNQSVYAFHDTELSSMVKNAAHAVAIDEHRVDYQVTLWKQIAKQGQSVEQRWFIGAHADVGGGYDSRALSDITLYWMQGKAKAADLEIEARYIPLISSANWAGAVTDSYEQFLDGVYAKTHAPYYRPIALSQYDQTMDAQVVARRDHDPSYRPQNTGFPP